MTEEEAQAFTVRMVRRFVKRGHSAKDIEEVFRDLWHVNETHLALVRDTLHGMKGV